MNGLWLRGVPAQVSGFPLGVATGAVFTLFIVSLNDQLTANLGQKPFVYEPPAGYAPGLWE